MAAAFVPRTNVRRYKEWNHDTYFHFGLLVKPLALLYLGNDANVCTGATAGP